MEQIIEFETPENVKVRYELAGLGSRFLAWFVDQVLLLLFFLLLFIVLMIGNIGVGRTFDRFVMNRNGGDEQGFYVMGIATLALGLASFFYFGLFELLMHGQTIGKRNVSIRVVKMNGFALDGTSILLRSLFRIVDNIPVFWLVPFFSKYMQRLGDMVAGTVVIIDSPKKLNSLRDVLLERPASMRMFRISPVALKQLREVDAEAAEKLLERWESLPPVQREELAATICRGLAARLNMPEPEPAHCQRFLEDLLSAEYQRRHNQLG